MKSIYLPLFLLYASLIDANERIPAEEFAKLPVFDNPQVSPNGEYLASRVLIDSQLILFVQSLKHKSANQREAYSIVLGDKKINRYFWVNDERLVLNIRLTDEVAGEQLSINRLISVDKAGNNVVEFPMRVGKNGFFMQQPEVIDLLKHDSKHVLAVLDNDEERWGAPEVHKVNVYTGEKTRILRNYLNIHEWITDNTGSVRLGLRYSTSKAEQSVLIYYRENEKKSFEVLDKSGYFEKERIRPVKFNETDPNLLVVSTIDEQNKDQSALFNFNLSEQKIVGPYTNSLYERVLKPIEKALPEHVVSIVSRTSNDKYFIIRVETDIKPPMYYHMSTEDYKLVPLGSTNPKLAKFDHLPMKTVSYTARDGLIIPAFLTMPNAKKLPPLIVYPHGGPWSHDEWGFDNYVQFFANRGYAVFQPQFRGSTGYGYQHEQKGYGQWGYAIQDDITDGVKWLIDKKLVDPKRICIVGASFGGYAAAMGLVKTPKLYKCGVSIAGVLDLEQDLRDLENYLFGSRFKITSNNKETAEEVSPFHQADKIKSPFLLIHGTNDSVVPVQHSQKMFEKLTELNRPVTYLELKDGEHWRSNEKHEIATFNALESFLSKHLKQI
ncbi:MAG: S9 family peptidase [Gammaproteobacteria bacterium]|nr:S9 family peptidase [Gammaproteobacteria bacterium]